MLATFSAYSLPEVLANPLLQNLFFEHYLDTQLQARFGDGYETDPKYAGLREAIRNFIDAGTTYIRYQYLSQAMGDWRTEATWITDVIPALIYVKQLEKRLQETTSGEAKSLYQQVSGLIDHYLVSGDASQLNQLTATVDSFPEQKKWLLANIVQQLTLALTA